MNRLSKCVNFWVPLLFPLLGYTVLAAENETQPSCQDVNEIDFKNATIEGIVFKNGVAFMNDDPESKKPDWEIKITTESILSPEPAVKIKLLELWKNHLTGTGTFSVVKLYSCKNHRLVSIFSRDQAQVEKVKDDEIQLTVFNKYLGFRGWGEKESISLKWDRLKHDY